MSFQAVEWARSLPLDSLSAKFTLVMIASYADTEGTCFPKLSRLADDTTQSVDTVQRRIRDLEQLGVLVRLERWETPDRQVIVITEPGQERPPGARRSSNEIRLQLHVTANDVKARIAARKAESTEASDDENAPTPTATCTGGDPCTTVHHPPSQAGAPAPTAEPCGDLNRESNHQNKPASPPNPLAEGPSPATGSEQSEQQQAVREEQEAEQRFEDQLSRFEQAYGYPGSKPGLVRTIVRALSDSERGRLIRGGMGYAAWRTRQQKPPPWIDPRNFARDPALWDRYGVFAPEDPKPPVEMVALQFGSAGWRALAVARAIAGLPPPPRRAVTIPAPMPTGSASLAFFANEFGDVVLEEWVPVSSDRPECAAWAERAAEWLGERPSPRRIQLEGPPWLQIVIEAKILRYPEITGLLVPRTPTGFPPAKGSTGPPGEAV